MPLRVSKRRKLVKRKLSNTSFTMVNTMSNRPVSQLLMWSQGVDPTALSRMAVSRAGLGDISLDTVRVSQADAGLRQN